MPWLQDYIATEKWQFAPFLAEVLNWYEGEVPGVDRVLLYASAGYAADWEREPIAREGPPEWPLPEDVVVATEAMVFLGRSAESKATFFPAFGWMVEEAGRLSAPGHEVWAGDPGMWYQYVGSDAYRYGGRLCSVAELRADVGHLVSSYP